MQPSLNALQKVIHGLLQEITSAANGVHLVMSAGTAVGDVFMAGAIADHGLCRELYHTVRSF